VNLAPSAVVAEVTATIMFYEAFRVHRDRLASAPDLFSPDIRARLSDGAAIARQTYDDALATRERLSSQIERLFHEFPIIVSPTLPIAPPTIDEISDSKVRGLLPRNTRLFNLVGCPSVTIPVPDTPLPVGLHVAALRGADAALMSAAAAIATLLG